MLLLRNSGNKHQNNPLVSVQTDRHASAYIILDIFFKTLNLVLAYSFDRTTIHHLLR